MSIIPSMPAPPEMSQSPEPQPFTIEFINSERHAWAVFEHIIATPLMPPKVVYVGFDKFEEMLSLRKMHVIEPWKTYYEQSGHNWHFRFVKAFPNRAEAAMHANALRNKHGIKMMRRERYRIPIQCVGDGKVFHSARAAAQHYGISQGALSNHLNRRKGYETVHGMTFQRVMSK